MRNKGRTDGRTDGKTDKQTARQTDRIKDRIKDKANKKRELWVKKGIVVRQTTKESHSIANYNLSSRITD